MSGEAVERADAAAPGAAIHAAFAPLAGVAAFVLAAAFTPRVYGTYDAGEFTLALALGGVPHPSGYPLYTLLGSAFVRVLHAAGFAWPHAANLWSAAGFGVAVALFARLATRVASACGASGLAGVAAPPLAVLALLFHPLALEVATVAEVYAWHAAWVAGFLLVSLGAAERLARADDGARAAGLRVGLVAGVGLAHHLTSLLLALPVLAALALAARGRPGAAGRFLRTTAAAALLPLLAYGWIAWRAFHPAAYQWPLLEPSLASVWAHVTGAIYAGAYLGRSLTESFATLGVHGAVTLAGATLLALGFPFAAPAGPCRTLAVGLAAAAALQFLFVAVYGVPDVEAYALAPLVAGLATLPAAIARFGRANVASLACAGIAAALAFAVPGSLAGARGRAANTAAVEARIREVWRSIPFERGIVFWADDHVTRLVAYQRLEGERPRLVIENPKLLTWAPVRESFRRRVGVDPLAGLTLVTDADLALVPGNVARLTGQPVVDFAAFAAGR